MIMKRIYFRMDVRNERIWVSEGSEGNVFPSRIAA